MSNSKFSGLTISLKTNSSKRTATYHQHRINIITTSSSTITSIYTFSRASTSPMSHFRYNNNSKITNSPNFTRHQCTCRSILSYWNKCLFTMIIFHLLKSKPKCRINIHGPSSVNYFGINHTTTSNNSSIFRSTVIIQFNS